MGDIQHPSRRRTPPQRRIDDRFTAVYRVCDDHTLLAVEFGHILIASQKRGTR